ncbi:quinone oxidoreductase, partial [Burkholderia cepacia]|nr:quinone oxidoreductase [Burkholderia cepacia]
YAQERVLRADQVIKLPDAISDEAAASIMLQGLTAQYLLRRTYRVKAGDTILIQAAAGGVGLLVCQWANALGATVIGTVGSDE